MTECRDCHSSIFWAVTPSGSRMPVDTEPSDRGNVRIVDGARRGETPQAITLKLDDLRAAREENEVLYLSHYATCPNPERFRQPKKTSSHRDSR